jgi:uncharacterized protein (UPF0261 family)
MEEIAQVIAEKLNRSQGANGSNPFLKGIPVLDLVDKEFVDNEANFALFETLKKNLNLKLRSGKSMLILMMNSLLRKRRKCFTS